MPPAREASNKATTPESKGLKCVICSAIDLFQGLTDPGGYIAFTMQKDDVESCTIQASPNHGVPLRKWRSFVQGNPDCCYTFEKLVETVLDGSFDDIFFTKNQLITYPSCKLHSVASR